MQFVFSLLSEQSLIAFVQFLVGSWAKRNPAIPNKVIPVLTFVAAVFGFALAPVSAHAAGVLAPAAPFAGVLLGALGQNLFVTGAHSTWKNTLFPALRGTLTFFAAKWLENQSTTPEK